jgi:hypothetical protein
MLIIDYAIAESFDTKKGHNVGIVVVISCHQNIFIFEAQSPDDFRIICGHSPESSLIVQNMVEILPPDIKYQEITDFVSDFMQQVFESLKTSFNEN